MFWMRIRGIDLNRIYLVHTLKERQERGLFDVEKLQGYSWPDHIMALDEDVEASKPLRELLKEQAARVQ
jgi:hypothetical protein